MISILKNCKGWLIAVIVVVVAITSVVVLNLTKPYAVYADGTKVEDPYVVKAGGKELFLVEDPETAENVVETVLEAYQPEGAKINSVVVDKKITTDDKVLKRSEEPPRVLTEEEAVDYIIEANKEEDPLFSVTINADIGSVEDVKAKTTYKESDDLYKGQSEVKEKGKDGDQIVTNEVISVNGAVITSEVIDETVINESQDKIVYKGTKERPRDTVRADYGGKVMGSGSGATVANFALQFVGNPYVYGGTSLTNGADCSGFVQSVYSKFGVSLPRVVGPQSHCGKGVSYSEAKPGDLICYSGHIGIYIGGGNMVHAANSRKGIIVSSVHGGYGQITTVRRILE